MHLPEHAPQQLGATSTSATDVSVATTPPSHPQERSTGAHVVATFTCRHCGQEHPVSEAHYPHARHPAMCRTCARERRQAKRAAAAGLPLTAANVSAQRKKGRKKRVTISLSDYGIAALSVLAVGTTPSEVVEEALMRYLAGQSEEVVQYVRYTFERNLRK
jgi:hypothetical protein